MFCAFFSSVSYLMLLLFQLYCWIMSIATIERWLDANATKFFVVVDNAEGSH